MPNAEKYLDRPRTRVRRKDRRLDDREWMGRFLATATVGHLALCHEGRPLLHSNIFWWDGEGHVYWHTAGVGKLRAVLDQGAAEVCFSVSEQGRILPASTPFDFSTEYASVLCYGTARVVVDRADKRRGLEGLMAKYAPHLQPGRDYEPMPDGDVDQTSVYRLDVEDMVGKHNLKPENYPAYDPPGGSFLDEERQAGRVTMRPKELS